MPSLECARSAAWAASEPLNVSVAMKSETVKPMPPSMDTDAIICQFECAGMGASPSFTASHENESMPRNLPATRAVIIASDMPSNMLEGSMSSRKIPALANANRGTIKKLTIGCSESSRSWSGEITLSDALSTSLSQFICSLSRIVRFSSSVSSSSPLKCDMDRRMIFIYFFGANTGVAGTLNATSTPAIVGCMPELRNRNQIIPPMPR